VGARQKETSIVSHDDEDRVVCHLLALIPGERAGHASRNALEELDQAGEHCVSTVAIIEIAEKEEAALLFDQRDDSRRVSRSGDEVALLVSGLTVLSHFGGAFRDQIELALRASSALRWIVATPRVPGTPPRPVQIAARSPLLRA
jgi:hypothetical protein